MKKMGLCLYIIRMYYDASPYEKFIFIQLSNDPEIENKFHYLMIILIDVYP